jgi:6-pyruvoyltetrahydropterin/6-carboxytetrahydropterin synthase
MKAYLNRRYRFSASHRLHSDQMSADENRSTYGKCNNPHGHGHNYVLEVTVSGPVDRNGMVCNLVDLDDCVQREVVTKFDLENLNMRAEFANSVPTTENLCTVIYDILKRKFSAAHLERVRLEETMMNAFEFGNCEIW